MTWLEMIPCEMIRISKEKPKNVTVIDYRTYEDGRIVYGVRSDTKIEKEACQDRRGLVLQSREFPDLKERIRILEEKMKEPEARK